MSGWFFSTASRKSWLEKFNVASNEVTMKYQQSQLRLAEQAANLAVVNDKIEIEDLRASERVRHPSNFFTRLFNRAIYDHYRNEVSRVN